MTYFLTNHNKRQRPCCARGMITHNPLFGLWPIAQTPLVRFVVNLHWISGTTSCTTCRKVVDLLWICCTAFQLVVDKSKAILHYFDFLWTGFVVESTTNPQHLDVSRCCGFVVDLLYNLLYSKSTTIRPSGV
jgi:hypothetical protein